MLEMLDDLFKDQTNASQSLEADEIILIADRSGSMTAIQADAEGGINSFIKEQQKEGNANLTLVEFDDSIDAVYKQTDIKNVKDYQLVPRGMTALYDAIGATLANADKVQTTGKKIVVIVTDGGENASREWKQNTVFERIDSLKANGWDFLFLAANQDAMSIGTSLGMDAGETVNFAPTSGGTHAAYNLASTYTSNLRGGFSKAATIEMLDQQIQSYGSGDVFRSDGDDIIGEDVHKYGDDFFGPNTEEDSKDK